MLDLRYNRIGDQGAKWVAAALKENTCLTTLDLAGNLIRNQGAECLAAERGAKRASGGPSAAAFG